MLNSDDRRAIEGLFDRLAEVERRTPERDREAEALIYREIERQPGAPYYMAQTIIVEQRALELAERRIQELEAQLAGRDRYGDRQPVQRQRGPWDRADDRGDQGYRGMGGGGFLAGAAQTALGVAGGVLLGSAIGSLLGAGGAHAAEGGDSNRDDDQQQDDNANDDQQDDNSGDDGDFGGDDGGFDMGGDF